MNDFDDRLRAAGQRVPGGLIDLDPEPGDVARRSRRRSAVRGGLAAVLAVALVAGGVLAMTRGGGDEGESVGVQRPQFGGPYDGLESVGLPVTVEPDSGLADRQTVTARGSGFPPGATLAGTQCWLPESGGSADDCDLGNITISTADADGDFVAEVKVRRFIGTANGTFDCAEGGLELGCRIGFADAEDYDQSGSARIFFDPAVDGVQPPVFTVEPATELVDGDVVTVQGSGFAPDETALVTQCVLGGLDGMAACFANNPTAEIVADGDGGFTVEVPARRWVTTREGTADSATDVYGCRLVIQAERMPNPVRLTYGGAERPPPAPEYTLTPSEGLAHRQTVVFSGFDLGGVESLTIDQCVDQSPLSISCIPLERNDSDDVTPTVHPSDGSFSTPFEVWRWMWNAEGEPVDCAEEGRTCYLSPQGDGVPEVRVPLRFNGAEEGTAEPTVSAFGGPFAIGDFVAHSAENEPPGAVTRICYAGPGITRTFGSCIELVEETTSGVPLTLSGPPDGVAAGEWSLQLVAAGGVIAIDEVALDVQLR